MLRRDFFKAVAAFTAAAASAKAAVAAASPQQKAGVPQEVVESIRVELERVSHFERTLVDCLRDGSMVLIGVTGSSVGYEAFYRPSKAHGEPSPEQARHDSLMAMHRRGMIVVDDVTVWNNYSAVSVRFAICTGA